MVQFSISFSSILLFFAALYLMSSIKILREYERGVIFRLGRLLPKAKGPGIILVFWPIDRIVRVSLRTIVLDIPPQDVITRDNISIKVNAVAYFRVVDANKAIVAVENFLFATSQVAQTTLRSVLGQTEMDGLLAERDKINHKLQEIIDKQTDVWGIKVSNVEVKHIDLPQEMQRAMAKQAEAERERRAKVIRAEGEFQSAAKLVDAAKLMGDHPMALQLRYLQTLVEVSAEKNSTTIFPIPIDLIKPFLEKGK